MRSRILSALLLLGLAQAEPSRIYFILPPDTPPPVWELTRRIHRLFEDAVVAPLALRKAPPVRVYLAGSEEDLAGILESDFAVPRHLAGTRAQDQSPILQEVQGTWRLALRADLATNADPAVASTFTRNLGAVLWSASGHGSFATARTPALPWMLTGLPDWLGAWSAATLEQERLDTWRDRTARSTTGREASLLVHDLLAEKGPAALGPYLKYLNQGLPQPDAFQKAFEISEGDFLASFDKRVVRWRVKPVDLTFSPFAGQPDDLLPVVREETGRIRKYFNEVWNWPLAESRTITVTAEPTVLGDGWERYVVKPIFDFDRSGSNAVPWVLGEEGSLLSIPFDLPAKGRRKAQAEIYIASLLTATAPLERLDQLTWMRRGLAEVAMAMWAEAEGDRFLVNAEKVWRDGWDKRKAPFSLARLRTASDWDKLSTNVGPESALGLAAITVESLYNEMGPAPFKAWCKAMKSRSDITNCFKDIFGQDLTAYEEKVRSSLF